MFFWDSLAFSHHPMNVGNLISASFAFSKSSLYFWKFLVHVLLKPALKDFEHNLPSMWNEHNCTAVWIFFVIAFLWDWNKNSSLVATNEFFRFAATPSAALLTVSSFRIWNSSPGIPLSLLALFPVCKQNFLRPKWLHSKMSTSSWVTTPSWLCRSLKPFFSFFFQYSYFLFLSPLLNLLCFHSVLFVQECAHSCMKCSLDI